MGGIVRAKFANECMNSLHDNRILCFEKNKCFSKLLKNYAWKRHLFVQSHRSGLYVFIYKAKYLVHEKLVIYQKKKKKKHFIEKM